MLKGVLEYSGIYAKTCALRKSLLTYDDYVALASAGSIQKFAEMLGEKETYSEAMQAAKEHGLSRVYIERSLMASLYRDFASIFNFMTNENSRKYFDIVFLMYEDSIIKRFIRRIYDNKNINFALPKFSKFLQKHTGIDLERSGSAQSIEELIQSLDKTEFYEVLSKVDKNKATLFDYELAMDLHAYAKMKSYEEKHFNKADKKSQQHIRGTDADLRNIMWIYRANTFYEMDRDKIFSYLLPSNYKLTVAQIKDLVDAKSDEEFRAVLKTTAYKDVFKSLEVSELEDSYHRYMRKQYELIRRNNPFSITCITNHLYLKDLEIQNITTLLECVRYNLAPSLAIKKIYCRPAKVGDGID